MTRRPRRYIRRRTPMGDWMDFVSTVPAPTSTTAPAATTSGPGFFDKLGSAITNAFNQHPTVIVPPTTTVPVATGMSTTTMLALAGGAVILAVILTRRS